jgi:hypothetical protein
MSNRAAACLAARMLGLFSQVLIGTARGLRDT